MLTIGVVALGVTDVQRAAEFWSQALGYELRVDGLGGWATVLTPPDGAGTKIALQRSQTPPQEHPRLHLDQARANRSSGALLAGVDQAEPCTAALYGDDGQAGAAGQL